MAITRKIKIDGREVPFRASAAIPRMYRVRFRRDIFQDMRGLMQMLEKGNAEDSGMDVPSLEIFENIAFVMAKHADPNIPDDAETWLDGFSTFSIYQIMPQLLELWGLDMETKTGLKKKRGHRKGR